MPVDVLPIGIFHGEDLWQGKSLLLAGFGQTLLIAGVAIIISVILGTVLGVLRHAKIPVLSRFAMAYIEFVRSIPLILFLVFTHYGVMNLLFHNSNVLVSCLVGFSLFEAAYVAEIVRGGLRSIRPGEIQAAVSLGLSYPQQLRYVYLPLAFRRTMPALISQLVSLTKDTSLAAILGVIELNRAGEIIYERTYHDFEILLFLALVYFGLCYGLSRIGQHFEPEEARRHYKQENLLLRSMQA